jgi:hypothetical protein
MSDPSRDLDLKDDKAILRRMSPLWHFPDVSDHADVVG